MAAAWQGTWHEGHRLSGKTQRPSLGTTAPNDFELSWWGSCLGIMCLCVRVCAHVCMRTGRVSLLVAMGHCLQGFALHGNWGSYLCICTSSNINQWCVPFG